MKKISAPPNPVMTWATLVAKSSNTVPVYQVATEKTSDFGLGTDKSKNQTNACVII